MIGNENPSAEIIKRTYHVSYSLKEGKSPLCLASSNRFISPDKLLMFVNANDRINDRRVGCLHPIGYAISIGRKDIVKALKNLGADIALTDEDGNTVLHYVCSQNHISLRNILKTVPSSLLYVENNEGKTPLNCLLGEYKIEI